MIVFLPNIRFVPKGFIDVRRKDSQGGNGGRLDHRRGLATCKLEGYPSCNSGNVKVKNFTRGVRVKTSGDGRAVVVEERR